MMTDATSKTVTALVAALICVAGGLLAFGLTLWMPPPSPANAAADVDLALQEVPFDDLAAVNQALPEDVVVAVWADADMLARPAPAPPSSTGLTPSTDQAAGEPEQGVEPPDGGQPTAQRTAPEQGSAAPAQPPLRQVVGRVTRVDDPAQLAVELNRVQETGTVTTHIKNGVWLTVASPRTWHSSTAVTLAAVTALTGAVAALVMAVFWSPRRPRNAGAESLDAPWHPGGRPLSTPDLASSAAWHAASGGAGGPRSAGPRDAAGLPPGPAPVTPQSPPPDPQVPVLLTQRTTLVRGLADLAAKLPAEFEWQAANVLDAAGVRRIVPDGATFDPAVHHAVGTEPAPDAKLDDTIARTLRPGWEDRGQVMVPARVVLYALPEQPPKGPDNDSG
jgi:hypothetical protein